jgi:predicted ABC-type ATPase
VTSPLDARPIIVALAGPNGAGKTTFYGAHLARAGLRFVNADELARELAIGAYEAAEAGKNVRHALVEQGESFVFETVLSDPVGDKVEFLRSASALGYTVVLCFIGLESPELSDERVAMRVMQRGRDVPKRSSYRGIRGRSRTSAAPLASCRTSSSSTTAISVDRSARSRRSRQAGPSS